MNPSRIVRRCCNACWPRPLLASATLASAQPTYGNPSPTAGRETSQKANAAADQTIYQPVIYTNASKKGPGGGRHPRRDQEQQRDVPAEVHHQQHRGLRRDRIVERQFRRARALEPRSAAQGIRARLQPGRSRPGAQVPEDGQAQDDQVRRQVRHPEDRAGRLRAVRASTAARSARWPGCSARSPARAAARRRARSAAPPSARCIRKKRRASG